MTESGGALLLSPPLSAELTPLGCLDQPGILTNAVTREPDAPRSTWPGPHPPARLRPDVAEASSRDKGAGAFRKDCPASRAWPQ